MNAHPRVSADRATPTARKSGSGAATSTKHCSTPRRREHGAVRALPSTSRNAPRTSAWPSRFPRRGSSWCCAIPWIVPTPTGCTLWSDGLEPIDCFADACAAEPERIAEGWAPFWHYTRLGRYGAQLEHLFSVFPREQVHVVRYKDLVDAPQSSLNAICAFLGVEQNLLALVPAENSRPFVRSSLRSAAIARAIRAGARPQARTCVRRCGAPRASPWFGRCSATAPVAPSCRSASDGASSRSSPTTYGGSRNSRVAISTAGSTTKVAASSPPAREQDCRTRDRRERARSGRRIPHELGPQLVRAVGAARLVVEAKTLAVDTTLT